MQCVNVCYCLATFAVAASGFFTQPAFGAEPVDGKTFVIDNVNSNKPLVIEKDAKVAGAKVLQNSAAKTSGIWKLEKAGDGFFRIVNVHSGLALTVPGNSKEPVQIEQASPDNGDNQAWKFAKVDKFPTHYWIISKSSGLVLDVSGQSKDNGGALIQFPQKDATTKNQHWILKEEKAKK